MQAHAGKGLTVSPPFSKALGAPSPGTTLPVPSLADPRGQEVKARWVAALRPPWRTSRHADPPRHPLKPRRARRARVRGQPPSPAVRTPCSEPTRDRPRASRRVRRKGRPRWGAASAHARRGRGAGGGGRDPGLPRRQMGGVRCGGAGAPDLASALAFSQATLPHLPRG